MIFADYTFPMKNSHHRPFEHQKKSVAFLIKNKRAYDLSEMRTGKTLSSLWASDFLFHNNVIRKVLIISPLSTVRLVWSHNIFTNFPHRKFSIAHGTKEKRVKAIQSNAHYIIINHDGIKTCHEELLAQNFDIIIIDELTAFKNAQSDRSKIMIKLANAARAVWGLTGSPTPNSPTEAFGEAKVVNPTNPFLPKYFTRFKQMVEYEVAPYTWVPRPEAKQIVHQVLQPSIRHIRDECFDIPPMMHKEVGIEMSQQQNSEYKKMQKELYLQYEAGEITAVNAAVKLTKLLQISAGAVKDNEGKIYFLDDTPKLNYILELFEETGRSKLVVVSAFRASVDHLYNRLKEKGIKCNYIYGKMSLNERTAIINDFQSGELQILVVQPQAVSHGICLDATNIIVWHSLIASGEIYSQMIDRIVSASQKKKQYCEYLLGSKADRHMFNILRKKSDLSSEILKLFNDKSL